MPCGFSAELSAETVASRFGFEAVRVCSFDSSFLATNDSEAE